LPKALKVLKLLLAYGALSILPEPRASRMTGIYVAADEDEPLEFDRCVPKYWLCK